VSEQASDCLFVCLFACSSYGIEALTTRDNKKKTSDISLENAYQQNPRNPKVPKVRRDHDTPPPPTPQTKYPFFNLPWNPIILSVLGQ